jgi:hypothetical protein
VNPNLLIALAPGPSGFCKRRVISGTENVQRIDERIRDHGLNANFVCIGQLKSQADCVKHQPWKNFLRRYITIKSVANDRMTDSKEMSTNLVLAPGKRGDLEESIFRQAFTNEILCPA